MKNDHPKQGLIYPRATWYWLIRIIENPVGEDASKKTPLVNPGFWTTVMYRHIYLYI